jgi:hypothetical protein
MSRFARSWQLIQASRQVLAADNALLILPALSGLATVTLAGGYIWLAVSHGAFDALQHNAQHHDRSIPTPVYAWLFGWYVVQYFVVIFFNTALVGAAIAVLGGGRPTVGAAIRLALSRIGVILGYAVISATVGVVLHAISERLGVIGRLIEGALGLAWTAATFLVIPILAAEGVGPWQAIERSTVLLRKTWGENVIGNAGISLVMSIIACVIAAFCFAGITLFQHGNQVIGVALLAGSITALLIVVLLGATLSGIYAAAVYYFAVVGKPPVEFDSELVRSAFTGKDS